MPRRKQMMAGDVSGFISRHYPDKKKYEDLYIKLHQDPELSYQESQTARTIADWLRELGFEVKTAIGGHGVVGVLHNGPGNKVLLRAELDGLPVAEKTGLPYASTKTMHSVLNNAEEPVMHACGHDLHMSAQLGACELLVNGRGDWSGTLIALFQPAEETGMGARAMYDDGLYDPQKHNIPIPDVALGGHCMPLRAGALKTRVGVINAACSNIRVTLYGHGGHGSRPHTTVDPVVMACSIVMKLQTIVSRQINPLDTAVITVGSIHAGSAANIIPSQAVIELNVRAFKADVQARLLDLATKIIDNEAMIWGAPQPPTYEQVGLFPIVDNDEEATLHVAQYFENHFGKDFALDATQSAGSEDIAALIGTHPIPIVFWNYGCFDPATWDKAEKEGTINKIEGNHSAYFRPVIQPSLSVGLEAYVASALAYLQ